MIITLTNATHKSHRDETLLVTFCHVLSALLLPRKLSYVHCHFQAHDDSLILVVLHGILSHDDASFQMTLSWLPSPESSTEKGKQDRMMKILNWDVMITIKELCKYLRFFSLQQQFNSWRETIQPENGFMRWKKHLFCILISKNPIKMRALWFQLFHCLNLKSSSVFSLSKPEHCFP